jgi:predicted nuclease of restriction endonuclease-like RecB superfamily
MLPSDLLIHRQNGEELVPKRLPLDKRNQAIATDLIALFQNCQGKTQGELERQLKELEGTSTDYRIKRGLAHLLKSDTFSTFEVVSPLEPQLLRSRVFAQSAQSAPLPQTAPFTLKTIAEQLSQELNQEVLPSQIRTGLYADLNENKILTRFDAPTPEALLHRYNVSQVQGIFYKASQIRITAHRNDPGEYKLLFRYLKLFGLMAYIEGDADHGFTITIDGPTSLFKPSTRYGLDIAKLIPALLHVSKWSLVADLHLRDTYTKAEKTRRFALTSEGGLVTHYPPGKPYDSMLESSFVDRWESLKSEWKLEREVDLIPIPGSVMIPDFRLVHPSGRSVLLEIVGYWRPEYLRKKFSQVRQSGRDDLILAISERLNLEKAGVKLTNVSTPIVWFKDKLLPKAVLAVLEEFEEFDLA